jgi:hypothetical protein
MPIANNGVSFFASRQLSFIKVNQRPAAVSPFSFIYIHVCLDTVGSRFQDGWRNKE